MTGPFVSVVIPARDAEATIGEQLAALAEQRYNGDWEVVVADNGSTDATAATVERWRQRLPALRVLPVGAAKGINTARNAGALAARGEHLLYCDADDVVRPGWIAGLARAPRRARPGRRPVRRDSVERSRGALLAGRLCPRTVCRWRSAVCRTRWERTSAFAAKRLLESVASTSGFGRAARSSRSPGGCARGYRVGFAEDAVVAYRHRATLRGLACQQYLYGRADARFPALLPRRYPASRSASGAA